MRIINGYLLRLIVDTHIVVPVGERVIAFKGMMTLNETGAYIWKCLEDEINYDELLQAILDKYEIEMETAATDLDEFLDKARANGVIEE